MIHRALLTVALAAATLTVAPRSVRAQDTTRDTTRHGPQFDGTKLAAVTLTYQATVDSTRLAGDRVVQVSRTTFEGIPAWLVLETHPVPQAGTSADSVTLDLTTLAPLHWGAAWGNYVGTSAPLATVAADFRSDSMFVQVTGPPGGHSVTRPIPPGTLLTQAMIEVALHALPVAAGWRDSVWSPANEIGSTRIFPGELEVVGQEKLTVPAGSFDCWIVTLTTDVAQVTYWLAKSEGFVVKTSQLLPNNGGLFTYTLSRIAR